MHHFWCLIDAIEQRADDQRNDHGSPLQIASLQDIGNGVIHSQRVFEYGRDATGQTQSNAPTRLGHTDAADGSRSILVYTIHRRVLVHIFALLSANNDSLINDRKMGMQTRRLYKLIGTFAILCLFVEPVFAGPGGRIASAVFESFWGRIILALLTLFFLPLILLKYFDAKAATTRRE